MNGNRSAITVSTNFSYQLSVLTSNTPRSAGPQSSYHTAQRAPPPKHSIDCLLRDNKSAYKHAAFQANLDCVFDSTRKYRVVLCPVVEVPASGGLRLAMGVLGAEDQRVLCAGCG